MRRAMSKWRLIAIMKKVAKSFVRKIGSPDRRAFILKRIVPPATIARLRIAGGELSFTAAVALVFFTTWDD